MQAILEACALFMTMQVPTSVNWFRNILETETVVQIPNSPDSPDSSSCLLH